jgi:hypothetical protein
VVRIPLAQIEKPAEISAPEQSEDEPLATETQQLS